MSTVDELEDARVDLEALLEDVLYSVLGEETYPTEDPLGAGQIAASRLAIHDELADDYLGIEVRIGAVLARVLASRMLMIGAPTEDDLIDAVGELGNIIGGNVKTMLYHSARLSLPVAEVIPRAHDPLPDEVSVRGLVFGQVAEMALHLNPKIEGLYWPASTTDQVVETKA